jgi:phosphohistidine phosphatase
MGITVGCLASSPLVRADETAHILRTELHFPGAVVTSPLLLPEAPVDQTIAWLREIPEDPILVVSHLPLLPRLASTCLAGGGTFVGFHAGGVASLVFSGGAVSRGKGRLEWLLTPEQLLKCAGASPEDEEP